MQRDWPICTNGICGNPVMHPDDRYCSLACEERGERRKTRAILRKERTIAVRMQLHGDMHPCDPERLRRPRP